MKALKEIIKTAAIDQKALKGKRKTGKYEVKRNQYGWISWKDMPELPKLKEAWYAGSKVQANKLFITAALNLYHELRGSDYRHNYDPSHNFMYQEHLKELRKLLDSSTEGAKIKT